MAATSRGDDSSPAHPREMSIGRTSVFCWKLSLNLLVALREEQHQANSRDTKSNKPNGRVDHS